MPRFARLAAAVLLTAAVGPLTAPGAASAATCEPGSGVTVVVDFKGLGGGAQSVCDGSGAGQQASTLFARNGYELTYAQRQPGYVCRVDGVPESDPCVNTSPASAYWGLWWSDGETGTWSYSSLGVASLTIPAGGSVAFAWDDVDGSVKPSVAPPKQTAATPTPSPSPSVKPTPSQSPTVKPPPTQPQSASPTHTVEPTPTDTPTATPTESVSATPTPTLAPTEPPAPTPTPTPNASESPGGTEVGAQVVDGDDGLPTWVPVVVILVLFAGAGGAVLQRRRRGA